MKMSWRTSASSGLDEGDATVALRSTCNEALMDGNNNISSSSKDDRKSSSDDYNPGACESATAASSTTSSSSSSSSSSSISSSAPPIGDEDDVETNSLTAVQQQPHDRQQQQYHQGQATTSTSSTPPSATKVPSALSRSPQDMVVSVSSPADDPGGSMVNDTSTCTNGNSISSSNNSSSSMNGRQSAPGEYDSSGGPTDNNTANGGDLPSSSSSSSTSPSPGSDGGAGGDDDEEENENQQEGSSGSGSGSNNNNAPQDGMKNVDDTDGSDHEIPWSPQEDQSVCEFTHIIEDYSHKRDSGCKKAEYSATTVDDRGNRWRLIVYVNGNGRASNHHLSLFLQVADADDLPFGWKKAVSYVLTLEHPSGGNMSYAKRNPDKTFKMCPKAIDWGWSQFITSDKIQQEGFIQDDTLVVRASVTVKSSSVDIDLEDSELYLKCAVEEGKPDAVQLCLDQGASVNCQFKDDLYTPLHTACSANPSEDMDSESAAKILDGSMKVLELLLEKGADGNACNKWRETPLLIAANNGHKLAVEALLRHGADPSLCSEAGWSALTFAAHKGYDDIVSLLLKAGAPVNCRVTEDASTPLHKACAGAKVGHLSAVRLLLDGHADVHALNKWRETPLLTAANHGQAGAVEALLRAGADPCKCTDTGWSPLSIAAYKGHDDVVKLLLDEGAPTEEADPTLSALLQAATKGLPDTVELLLRYGADHTVTTKKGDTALSILVEQNLIDAAVEMVTEYKASIPRCSRDRKKVQRARLLINLRIKQQQRDGLSGSDDDGGEIDLNDLEDLEDYAAPSTPNEETKQPAGKGKKKKASAEQEAKEAEEALLLELEKEESQRSKQVEEASKKSAKKRKKKERERQLKKEQEEKRLAEEKALEAKRKKDQEAKEASENAERERLAAIRRKEEEEFRKRHQAEIQKKKREEEERAKQERREEEERKAKAAAAQNQAGKKVNTNGQTAPHSSKKKNTTNISTPTKAQQHQQSFSPAPLYGQAASAGSTKAVGSSSKPANAQMKKRGWETLPKKQSEPVVKQSPVPMKTNGPGTHTEPVANSPAMNGLKSDTVQAQQTLTPSALQSSSPDRSTVSITSASDASRQNAALIDEPPAVALFRREKVSELLHRCSVARATTDPLGFVSESVMRKVVMRWVMRAAHDSAEYLDFLLPSWVDIEKVVTFFQRQFITESRKGGTNGLGSGIQSMESLKDAGTAVALLCHSLAKDVADFKRQVIQQLPRDWTDMSVGMSATEIVGQRGTPIIVLDWAKQSQTSFSSHSFSKLINRFRSTQSRILSSIFVTKICVDAKSILVGDAVVDFRLPPAVKSRLVSEMSVTAEIWSDPFSVLNNNAFWGQSNEIDPLFGGFRPFSSDDGNDDRHLEKGGSIMSLLPPDNLLASRYLRRIFDILHVGEQSRVPLSFALFLQAECLLDGKSSISGNDLYYLEPRLRENPSIVSRVETLHPNRHAFHNEKTGKLEVSQTGSLFVVLQNSLGRSNYALSEMGAAGVLRSMEPVSDPHILSSGLPFTSQQPGSSSGFNVFAPPVGFMSSSNVATMPPSPLPSNPFASDFGSIQMPVSGHSNTFGTDPSPAHRAPATRRGRLFDLVEDDGDDNMNDVDVVSGMLGNLNVDDLFQVSGSHDIDIEAISLMGITGTPTKPTQPNTPQNPFR